MRRAAPVIALLGVCACADVKPPAPRTASRDDEAEARDDALPPQAVRYVTTASPPAADHGREAMALDAAIAAALAARDPNASAAEPDAALAATARWVLAARAAGRDPRHAEAEAVARRLGFAGVLPLVMSFSLDGPDADSWRRELAKAPANLIVNRYGLYASSGARAAAIAFGAVEMTLEPFATHVPVGQSVRLHGEANARYQSVHLYVTAPDGKIDERRFARRVIDATVKLPRAGSYKIEVMGDGASGPVVLVNVPVVAGDVREAKAKTAAGTTAPEAAEARLFVLLNQARARAGVATLAPDRELRDVALAHTEDMIRAGFFGHVSPTTGSVDDRLRRAGVDVTIGGENLARALTAEEAHEGLMESPGHRANLLAPHFTHVGIAAVPAPDGILVVTEVFGRRPAKDAARKSLADVMAALAAARRAAHATPITIDPGLQKAAEAGVASGDRSVDGVVRAATASLRAQRRPGTGCARVYELRELEQLADVPELVDRRLARVGLGVTTREDAAGARLVLLLLSDGAGCP